MIDDFLAKKKKIKLKNLTCFVDTLHYRLLRLLLMGKLEQYLFVFFNGSLCTASVKNSPSFWILTGMTPKPV